ncbi:cytochrome P450 2J2-like [Synchiropus splendidus]|uniref:cytochrome P450 2J2-like n=1 Tax=Synchiropus splendidus TaxID=270530 RepID=UPI00237EBD95|nr:cytochrome P450 2J2-like [Synchiropus splendidus]
MIFHKLFESLDLTSWLLVCFVVLILIDLVKYRRPHNFPPGPTPLPIVGNLFTGSDFKNINKLSHHYGSVFSMRRGSTWTIYVSGYNMVKEALVNQLDSFVDRPVVPLFHVVFKGIGIGLGNGYSWKMHRKFTVTFLRHYGEVQKTYERSTEVESNFLCEAFKEEQGKPFNPHYTVTSAVANIVTSLVFGRRYEYSDVTYRRILKLDYDAVVLAGSPVTQLYDVFPSVFKYLPGPHQTVLSNYRQIVKFVEMQVEKHLEDWNPDNPRDFIDAYVAEMKKKKEDPLAEFNLESLGVVVLDLIEGGTETVATAFRWSLLFMMLFPEIQKKVQEEIDRVVGQSRMPTMVDKPNMPYTEATIHECLRVANILPLGFPKMASKDTTLAGFSIPKGTPIVASLSSVLCDEAEWESPASFRPERFLDSEGRFNRKNAFLAFSAGKRVCIGETLAKIELFVFFTSLLQRFTLTQVPGEELTMEGILGFTYSPQDHRIMAIPR